MCSNLQISVALFVRLQWDCDEVFCPVHFRRDRSSKTLCKPSEGARPDQQRRKVCRVDLVKRREKGISCTLVKPVKRS